MHSTPLHHKPVIYGSALADGAFIALVALHALVAGVALVAGIVALASKKGGRLHVRAGAAFVWTMIASAVSGALLVAIRFAVNVEANHTHYAGTSMPSTYPARIAFFFSALSLVYMAWGVRGRILRRDAPRLPPWLLPSALVLLGAGATAYIALALNPWTGALWMIWTFMAAVALTGRYRARLDRRADRVSEHRFVMLFLGAFSWWAALQGFGPALGAALGGLEGAPRPYVGDQPGPFHPRFFFFLAVWLPAFALGGWLLHRFRRRALRPA